MMDPYGIANFQAVQSPAKFFAVSITVIVVTVAGLMWLFQPSPAAVRLSGCLIEIDGKMSNLTTVQMLTSKDDTTIFGHVTKVYFDIPGFFGDWASYVSPADRDAIKLAFERCQDGQS